MGTLTADDVLAAPHRWYHTVDLEAGKATPGWVDLRQHVEQAGIPADLTGMRAIDLGMFDGFWSFTMERRGATVIGIDIDDIPPPDIPRIHYTRVREEAERDGLVTGRGFALLKEFFGSSVERNVGSVMTLTPERVGGPVDFAFFGALLLHLRDPLGALEAVFSTLRPGGRLICYEPVVKPGRGQKTPAAEFRAREGVWTYWYPNHACLVDWVRTAGFADVQTHSVHPITDTTGDKQYVAAVHARRPD